LQIEYLKFQNIELKSQNDDLQVENDNLQVQNENLKKKIIEQDQASLDVHEKKEKIGKEKWKILRKSIHKLAEHIRVVCRIRPGTPRETELKKA